MRMSQVNLPTPLPAQPTPFWGRVQELAEIEGLLADPDCRLLTLVGPGGVGKTRLALEVAAHGTYPDGVHFVALQPLGSPSLIVSAIADALRLTFYGQDNPQTQLFNFLSAKRLLLVLDNFEHLLDGVGLVSDLLASAPGVKVLTTSREVLSLQEEWLYTVRGMAFPQSAYSEPVESYEAVQFFLHNARRVQPDFSLDAQQADMIQVCRLTEGMPLALEMAASWLKALTCRQIASEMQRSMNFLTIHTRNVPERHRSMRAVFNHSWNLLAEEERQVFAKLSVFRGGFEREAVEPVAGATLPILAALVEKSLVRKLSSGRYDIHELLRQYGEEQLEASGTGDTARGAHSRCYAEFMREREIDLKGRRQIEGLSDVDVDFENIRVAWDWALNQRDVSIVHQMVECLLWFGLIRSRQHDVNGLFNDALAQVTGDRSEFVKARIVSRQSLLLPYDDPPHLVAARLEESLTTIEQYADESEIAICTMLLGLFLGGVEQRDFQRALTCAQNSFAYFEAAGDRYYLAYALHAYAWIYYYQGERQKAMQYAHQCAQIRRDIGDHYGTARILLLVAAEAYSIPDYDKAERFNREIRDIWQQLKSWNLVAFVNGNLAYLAIFRGDFEAARALLDESLTLARAVNIHDHIAYPLALSGVLASLEERYVEAWQLLSEAKQLATFTSSVEALEWGLPLAACGLGDYETARSANQRAFQFSRRLNAPGRYLWHLPAACVILAHEGDTERAAELLGLAFTHPASAPAWMQKWPLLTRLRDQLEAELGAAAYQAAWDRGTSLDLETVVTELLLEFRDNPEPQHPVNQALPDPLTPRELEVLQLIAEGLSNQQIADTLVIGVGTAKTHTLSIYRKLDVNSRTQAIVRARELRLIAHL
jgi:predicted ATPase/DNA-binding CsgD family transcriptional regulator